MSESVINSFQGGLNLDTPNYQTPNTVYTYLENGTFITHEGNEMILQNEKGTISKTSLKEGYVPLAVKAYGQIAYIVSAELEYTEATVEIECYTEVAAQHITKLQPGTYKVTFTTSESLDITLSLDTLGTVYSNIVDGEESFELEVLELSNLKTNKTGGLYGLTIDLLDVDKKLTGFTGRGEIGTYPSPDYANTVNINCGQECDKQTVLIDEYAALQNYKGDDGIPINPLVETTYGEFNSSEFNFQTDKALEIVAIQPSYDGTVNIIFTDGFNSPKLINSRFTVEGDDVVRINNREGSQDSNLYTQSDFDSKLNHILTSSSLVDFTMVEQTLDGQLPTGVYRYYFKYQTQDGNQTDFIAESFSVPVFISDGTVASTRGGISNENSDKSNILRLDGLDTTFGFIKMYISYSSGDSGTEAVTRVFEVLEPYAITSSSLDIKHTGFETTTEVGESVLQDSEQIISTYETGCEVKGRLFVGNIKGFEYDFRVLRDFARNITIEPKYVDLDVVGFNESDTLSELYSGIPYNATNTAGTWRGGYYNPLNTHDYLGYWGGESYMFAARFVFKNGGKSLPFPVRGLDNLSGNSNYSDNTLSSDNLYNSTTGENLKGIYRFPHREKEQVSQIIHPEFVVPEITSEMIAQGVIGIQFTRSRRKIDCKGQGLLFETLVIPSITDVTKRLFNFNEGGYDESNSKLIPAYEYLLEAPYRDGALDSNGNRAADSPSDDDTGIEPVTWSYDNYEGNLSFWLNKRYALITPDLMANKTQTVRDLSGSNFKLDVKWRFKAVHSKSTSRVLADANSGRYFSVIKQSGTEFSNVGEIDAELDFVQAGNDTTTEKRFSSRANFAGRFQSIYDANDIIPGSNYRDNVFWSEFDYIYNDYIGVDLEESLGITTKTEVPTNLDGKYEEERTYQGRISQGGYIVNIYKNGIRSTEVLNLVYNPGSESFFSISKPYYFTQALAEEYGQVLEDGSYNTLEAINHRLPSFNGDCFVNLNFRRIFFSALDEGDVSNGLERLSNVGYTIAFVAESNFNIAGRNTEIIAVNEGERGFYPYSATTNDQGDQRGQGNDWRELRILESEAYNAGYNKTFGDLLKTGVNNTPFQLTNFETRISFSDPYTQSTFSNGYRVFGALAYRDYSRHLGKIVALRSTNGALVCVQEYGVSVIPVNERIGTTGDTAGPVFFEDVGVLPEPKHVGYISEKYGSKWKHSVVATDNTIYGIDVSQSKIWRVKGSSLDFISDFKVQSELRRLSQLFKNKTYDWLKADIRTYYDSFKQDLIFSFNRLDASKCETVPNPDNVVCPTSSIQGSILSFSGGQVLEVSDSSVICTDGIESTNLVFNEQVTNQWKGFMSPNTYLLFNINDDIFSFNYLNDRETLHQWHKSDLFNVYFDKQEYFVLEFNVTGNTQLHWIYENIKIIGNHIYPEKIEYTTDKGVVQQTVRPRNVEVDDGTGYQQEPLENLFNFNAIVREDHLYITIGKEEDDNAITDYNNLRIRDKYCKVKLYYNTSKQLIIQAVNTFISRSSS